MPNYPLLTGPETTEETVIVTEYSHREIYYNISITPTANWRDERMSQLIEECKIFFKPKRKKIKRNLPDWF